jgi:excinuclease ABC subunit B
VQRVPHYFPRQRVEYFVSYYDYYQPEAYVPSRTSTSRRTRRSTRRSTACATPRRPACSRAGDVISSLVSAIFGLGSPRPTTRTCSCSRGEEIDRDEPARKLVSLQYTRNDVALGRGNFRVRGEDLEIFPAYAESAYRATFFGDEVERSSTSTR